MADLPTIADLLASGQGAYRTLGDPGGTGAVNLRPGSRNDTLLSVMLALLVRLLTYTADSIGASRLSSATGADLDLIGRDLFNNPRKGIAAAVGTAYLRRTGTGATVIPAGTRVAVPASPGQAAVVFTTDADVSVGTGVTTAACAITAQTAGASGNVPLATLTAILDPLPDGTWTLYVPISGPAPDVIGFGADLEDDDTYRARLRSQSIDDSRQKGVKRAITTAALAVPGVAFVTAIEPLDGTVVLYAGDASYALPAAGKALIDTTLLDFRGFGVPVVVRPYAVNVVTIAMAIYMTRALSNYDVAAIQAAAYAALSDLFTSTAAPDEYFVGAIESAGFKGHVEVQNVILASPTADQLRPADPGYGAVTALTRYVVTPASVSISVHPPQTM